MSPQSLLFTAGMASLRARGKQQKLWNGEKVQLPRALPVSSGLGWWRPRAPGAGMDRTTKPELRSDPWDALKIPGERGVVARKDVWDGGTGGSALWKSPSRPWWWRKASGQLRSRHGSGAGSWAVNPQSCSPGGSVAIWDDLGKSHSSRTGRDSTSPAGGEDVPAGISFPHRIPSLPTLLLPGCPPGAASFPLHSQIIPFRRSARRNPSHNTHGDPTAHPCSASMHRGILPTKKKKTPWEKGQRAWEEEQLDLLC